MAGLLTFAPLRRKPRAEQETEAREGEELEIRLKKMRSARMLSHHTHGISD